MSRIKEFPNEFKDKLLNIGIVEDEIKILQAWRFITFGQIIAYKKENKLSGRIDIKTTY